MTTGGRISTFAAAALTAAALAPAAYAQDSGASKSSATAAANTPVSIKVIRAKRPMILQKALVTGVAPQSDSGTRIRVTVRASGRKLFSKLANPDDATGRYRLPMRITACCKYVITAKRNSDRAVARFQTRVPKGLKTGPRTRYFHKLLAKQGFHVDNFSKRRNWSTNLAIKAFRKTNGMGRSHRYHPSIYRKLARGKGAFKPKYRKQKGRYVEVDISRQVMALINNGKAVHTFHVSTGASSTPTVRGKYRFYMRQAGYNSKRMYYSVYFIRGYATHGFDPVPDYPASHGCVRNPIPYSKFIYNWVQIGMPIYTYL